MGKVPVFLVKHVAPALRDTAEDMLDGVGDHGAGRVFPTATPPTATPPNATELKPPSAARFWAAVPVSKVTLACWFPDRNLAIQDP